jgi:hypothetical protein
MCSRSSSGDARGRGRPSNAPTSARTLAGVTVGGGRPVVVFDEAPALEDDDALAGVMNTFGCSTMSKTAPLDVSDDVLKPEAALRP